MHVELVALLRESEGRRPVSPKRGLSWARGPQRIHNLRRVVLPGTVSKQVELRRISNESQRDSVVRFKVTLTIFLSLSCKAVSHWR